MMHGENVNLLNGHNSVDDSIRPEDNFTDHGIGVFGNCATRLRKILKPICRVKKSPDNYVGVVRRADFNERADCCEIRLRALSPVDRRHARKRFFTSS